MGSDDIALVADALSKTHVRDEELSYEGRGLKMDNAESDESTDCKHTFIFKSLSNCSTIEDFNVALFSINANTVNGFANNLSCVGESGSLCSEGVGVGNRGVPGTTGPVVGGKHSGSGGSAGYHQSLGEKRPASVTRKREP
jgi:hypothetical protein